MKYTAEAFDEWWFTTQFDRAYWQVNSQKYQTEYKWAKLAWDAARRDLLEEVERLNRVFANQGNLREEIVELKSQLQAAQALAATHLTDQELLMARERKRVAEECIDYVNNHANDCGCSKRIAHDIRTRYGMD